MKSSDLGKEVIRKELSLIPKSPGVYRMLNHKGDILYVGKAKNLPNRLKSYVSEKKSHNKKLKECCLKLLKLRSQQLEMKVRHCS